MARGRTAPADGTNATRSAPRRAYAAVMLASTLATMSDPSVRAVLSPVNNVLALPGVFRGLLDARVTGVSAEVELAAATALAATVPPQVRSAEYILPSVFDKHVVSAVAKAVAAATRAAGLSRRTSLRDE